MLVVFHYETILNIVLFCNMQLITQLNKDIFKLIVTKLQMGPYLSVPKKEKNSEDDENSKVISPLPVI